ncbi:hypothetical protein KR51_00008090 [Rubidibacter lacunae KORDI 51-2]|uniref:Transposase Helix-turn-helix domain-containing protein n=1 Tax=Rubidibacter lacunae KORDI 51-2 TaxID=582515 RepID=U5DS31_9CHRO|nr:hypothetical protein KR51_00008090 [Rubidibacter lacunae KORDI 51-2]
MSALVPDNVSPDVALQVLLGVNQRLVQHQPQYPDRSRAREKEVSLAQKPHTTVLSCVDSRVPLEILFDMGIGDVFKELDGSAFRLERTTLRLDLLQTQSVLRQRAILTLPLPNDSRNCPSPKPFSQFKQRFAVNARGSTAWLTPLTRECESQKSRASLCFVPQAQVPDTREYLREYRTFFHIARDWGVSKSTICRDDYRVAEVFMSTHIYQDLAETFMQL